MWLWPQVSQAATGPPRAAVRQRSMAAMTSSWARLRWPALAVRQAGPWARKISATSSARRGMGMLPPLGEVERTPEPRESALPLPIRTCRLPPRTTARAVSSVAPFRKFGRIEKGFDLGAVRGRLEGTNLLRHRRPLPYDEFIESPVNPCRLVAPRHLFARSDNRFRR